MLAYGGRGREGGKEGGRAGGGEGGGEGGRAWALEQKATGRNSQKYSTF
jgi:hypothetical protein